LSNNCSIASLLLLQLGSYPEEIFEAFDAAPIASASLAQVHTALDKRTRKKIAIKIQVNAGAKR
jgi:aarF domain-containing kinase